MTALERRRYVRIAPKGSVMASVGGNTHVGRIGNLSAGGAFVVTTMNHDIGSAVDVELRVGAAAATWLKTIGHVVRIEQDGVAIAFDTPSEHLVRMIDELTTRARDAVRVTSVVLIDTDEQRRSAMGAGLRAAGCTVVEAASTLEAIVRLGESSFDPDVVAISTTCQTMEAQAIRTFVTRAHPHSRVIEIDDTMFEPDGFAKWLGVAPKADLSMTGREVLVRGRLS